MKIKRILAFLFILTGIFGTFAFTTDYDVAPSKVDFYASPCKMRITNNSSNFHGLSLNNRNVYAYANSTTTRPCPCTGYIQLFTPGPVYWELINNTPGTFSYGNVVGGSTMNGVLYSNNYSYTPVPCTATECF